MKLAYWGFFRKTKVADDHLQVKFESTVNEQINAHGWKPLGPAQIAINDAGHCFVLQTLMHDD